MTSLLFLLFRYYLSGIGILVTAIMMNVLIQQLSWSTWYDVLSSSNNLSRITLANWLFLLIIYPLTLAVIGVTIFTKSK